MTDGEGGGDWNVIETVVTRTAAQRGRDPTGLDPLVRSIDPELVRAFATSDAVLPDSVLRFEYCGCVVSIDGSGDVSVEIQD